MARACMNDMVVYKDEKNGVVRAYNKNSYLTEFFLEDYAKSTSTDIFSEYVCQTRHHYNFTRGDMDFCKMVTDQKDAFAEIKDGDYLRIDLKSGQFEIRPCDKCLPQKNAMKKSKTR